MMIKGIYEFAKRKFMTKRVYELAKKKFQDGDEWGVNYVTNTVFMNFGSGRVLRMVVLGLGAPSRGSFLTSGEII